MTRAVLLAVLLAPALAWADPTDDDLASLDVDHPDDHVMIGGFADVSWRALLIPKTSLAANYYPKENSFLVGNVNLYVTKNVAPQWRSFLEIRYLYAPSGTLNSDGTLTHATAPDPADLERPVNWGGISIQRAYLEYELDSRLTIQAGTFLTPYGIWNVDHGSPTIIPVVRPYVIGANLFPSQQTGLHVYGTYAFDAYQLRYHATLSNGRGPLDSFRDLDDNKAIGGRLELETPWLGSLRLGLSAYHGRFTDRPADVIGSDANGNPINTTPAGTSYLETAYGFDALLVHGGLHVQLELIGNVQKYSEGARALSGTGGGFLADSDYKGGYLLVGYRFDRWWQMMPFVQVEADAMPSSPDFGNEPRIYQSWWGLNFRPEASVTLKINYVYGVFRSPTIDLDYKALFTQAAWAF